MGFFGFLLFCGVSGTRLLHCDHTQKKRLHEAQREVENNAGQKKCKINLLKTVFAGFPLCNVLTRISPRDLLSCGRENEDHGSSSND